MPKYEIALAVKDAQEFGNPRKKQGDLVAVIPHDAQWGSGVIGAYFIVIVETAIPFDKLRKACAQRLYRHKATGTLVTSDDYEKATAPVEDGGLGKDPNVFEVYAKNRYCIHFNKVKDHISDLAMIKVQNEGYVYQPFKKASKLVEGFDGMNGHNYLDINDMDTACNVAGTEEEFSINLDKILPFIWDKYTEEYIRP